MENVTTTEKAQVVKMRVGVFSGAHGAFGHSAFLDLFYAGFSKRQAQLMAMDYVADLGNAMKNDADLASRVGKANKEGQTRIRISGKSGKTPMTRVMAIVRIAQTLDNLHKEGIYSRKMGTDGLADTLKDYVASVDARVEKTAWESAE